MKKIFLLSVFSFIFLFPFWSVSAQSEQINSFLSDISINKDTSYEVREIIEYDFGTNQKHGIYRSIPYRYKRAEGDFSVKIHIQRIEDEQGSPYKYQVSYEGDNVVIKIGDPDRTISGLHTYMLIYIIERGINRFENHDELYWNVTGNGWPVPIKNVLATVRLPDVVNQDDVKLGCFKGMYGSTTPCQYSYEENSIVYEASDLQAREGLTILLGLPRDILVMPTFLQQLWWYMQDNWALFVPFIILFILLLRWWKYGRDPETGKHIAPMYDAPTSMTPPEVGVLVDEKVDTRDVSAMIVSLAIRGYLKIKEVESKVLFFKQKDYQFIRLKEADAHLKEFEKTLLDGIFNGEDQKNLSALKDSFFTTLKDIRKYLYTSVTKDGYFPISPEKVRAVYAGVGIFVALAGSAAAILLQNITYVLGFLPSGFLVALFGQIMPRKTKKGMENYIHILGLKLYLNRAEKKQIDFFNAPEKKPEVFEKFLPYAMALGVETAWAKEFEDMYKEPPDWYEGQDWHTFNTMSLVNSLHSFSSSSQSTFSSSPSSAGSGGSGFSGGGSGGGFGGGGGGSW